MANADSKGGSRDAAAILAFWLFLAGILLFLAIPNISVPGLFYDEAHCAAMAKDFLTGRVHPHMPGSAFLGVCDCRVPTFVQSYGGALKSWLLLPSLAVFGTSQLVLRLTALGWGLVALLLFMLWTRRWLGRNTALLAGALLALDPTFFFINVLDWGPVFPSFLCRFACFYFALRGWQSRREPGADRPGGSFQAFLAGLFAGLGFFNKIDFAIILAGVSLALLCCHGGQVRAFLALRRFSTLVRPLGLASIGFLLTAGPMLMHVPRILNNHLPHSGDWESTSGELSVKLVAALAMYDGTYFYRLMDQGGVFDQIDQTRPPIFVPLGVALVLASGLAVFRSGGPRSFLRRSSESAEPFIVLSIVFITIGVFALPEAVRIHHMVAVYPFPHLAVALAVTRLSFPPRRFRSLAVAALAVLLLGSQVLALLATQRLIRETGGRGWWSDALNAFAREVKDRSDMTIVSLDWGFNEQLAFLTDGPTLREPFWSRDLSLPRSANTIYLVHPPEYSRFPFGQRVLEEARSAAPESVELRAWRDHQGQIAFYSLRWSDPEGVRGLESE